MNRLAVYTLAGMTLLLAPLSYGADTPSPKAVWREIQSVQKANALMPESRVLQPGSRTVDYYTTDLGNGPASMTIKKAGGVVQVRRYPNGSLLVKENYNKDRKLTGIAAMLKLAGYDPADRNWVMAAYGPTGKALAFGKIGTCISCHVMVRKQDLVFAPPPTQLLSASTWKAFFPKQEITPVYDKLLKMHPGAIVQ
jgi:hypothetical protein